MSYIARIRTQAGINIISHNGSKGYLKPHYSLIAGIALSYYHTANKLIKTKQSLSNILHLTL